MLRVEQASSPNIEVRLELYPVRHKTKKTTKEFDDILQTCREKTLEELEKTAINTRGEDD